MQATGIIRKVDELGRIVLPKDIRRSLNLKVGTPLEIYLNGNTLILKQYSQLQNLKQQAENIAECLSKSLECDVIVTDLSTVISSFGKCKKIAENATITPALEKVISQRKTTIHNKLNVKNNIQFIQAELPTYTSIIVCPILVNGDCLGSILCLSADKELLPADVKCVNVVNCLLVKQCDL